MIEKYLITYLNSVMDVPVCMEAPINKPEKYVLLQKIDSGIINHINAASFSVDCYAKSLLQAAELSELVKGHMLNAITLNTISGVSLGSEKSNVNTNTKTYSYECVFNFYYY